MSLRMAPVTEARHLARHLVGQSTEQAELSVKDLLIRLHYLAATKIMISKLQQQPILPS